MKKFTVTTFDRLLSRVILLLSTGLLSVFNCFPKLL